METFDVAIVGGGPAGSSCAAFCAHAGLQTIVLEREKFPREKVCGDCLNPACWPVLERLDLAQHVRALPHAKLDFVEFIAVGGRRWPQLDCGTPLQLIAATRTRAHCVAIASAVAEQIWQFGGAAISPERLFRLGAGE